MESYMDHMNSILGIYIHAPFKIVNKNKYIKIQNQALDNSNTPKINIY